MQIKTRCEIDYCSEKAAKKIQHELNIGLHFILIFDLILIRSLYSTSRTNCRSVAPGRKKIGEANFDSTFM